MSIYFQTIPHACHGTSQMVSQTKQILNGASYLQGRREDLGGPRAKAKSGAPQSGLWKGGWGHAPRKFWDLLALKCVLGLLHQALFRACTQYIYYSCKFPSSISGFRSKSTTYRAPRKIICVSGIKHIAKEQVDFSRKYSETNPLKKLDWNMTDERILFEQVQHCLGAPVTLGGRGKLPLLPPTCRRHCLFVWRVHPRSSWCRS